MPNPPHPPPAEWLTLIIKELFGCLGRCVGPNPRAMSGLPNPRVSDPLLMEIWERLRRINVRFTKRLARYIAGVPPPSRIAAKPAPDPSITDGINDSINDDAEPAAKPAVRRWKTDLTLLPRKYGWLLALIQETAGGRQQFCYFLAQPNITALLAADPHLRRILRPLCHIMGIPRVNAASLWPSPPPPRIDAAPPPDAPPAEPAIPCETPPEPAAPQAAPITPPAAATAPPPPEAPISDPAFLDDLT